jgi:hypothetical protein
MPSTTHMAGDWVRPLSQDRRSLERRWHLHSIPQEIIATGVARTFELIQSSFLRRIDLEHYAPRPPARLRNEMALPRAVDALIAEGELMAVDVRRSNRPSAITSGNQSRS